MTAFKWLPEHDTTLREMYPANNRDKIARVIGCNPSTVGYAIKRLGLKGPGSGRLPDGKHALVAARDPMARQASPWGSYSPQRHCTGNMREPYTGAELRTVPARFLGAVA